MMYLSGQCRVDMDKIIEQTTESEGFYTAIGIGGKGDGVKGNCYARKCGLESKIVDEDSEDEGEEEFDSSQEDRHACRQHIDDDGDHQMA